MVVGVRRWARRERDSYETISVFLSETEPPFSCWKCVGVMAEERERERGVMLWWFSGEERRSAAAGFS